MQPATADQNGKTKQKNVQSTWGQLEALELIYSQLLKQNHSFPTDELMQIQHNCLFCWNTGVWRKREPLISC